MSVSRREFLGFLSAAGIALSADHWLIDPLEAYADDRLGFDDLRGPGVEAFSHSVCRDCANHCSLALRTIDGLPVGVRGVRWNPFTMGGLCPAGLSKMQALFDPDRLSQALVRESAGENATQLPVAQAVQQLGERLQALIAAGGGERLVVVDGRTPSLGTRAVEAWTAAIPGARYVSLTDMHAFDRIAANILGGQTGKGRLAFDLAHTGTLLLVGNELLEADGSPVTQMRLHGNRREDPRVDNAPTLYMGSRRGPTGANADLWIAVPPGAERAVLLALADALSRGHPQHDKILAEYRKWIPEAADPLSFAREFSVEAVASRVGIDIDILRAAVRALKAHQPAVVLPGPSILRRVGGSFDGRAALALNFWTRGFESSGGLSWVADPLDAATELAGIQTRAPFAGPALMDVFRPLFEIKRSPVDIIVTIEANLVHELGGGDQVARALTHVPFLCSFTPYEDETSKVAKLTIPSLLDLESWDLPASPWGVSDSVMQVQRPALEPVIDSIAVEDALLGLDVAGSGASRVQARASNMKELVAAAAPAVLEGKNTSLHGSSGHRSVNDLSPRAVLRDFLRGDAITSAPPQSHRVGESTPWDAGSLPHPVIASAEQYWLNPFDGATSRAGRLLNRPMMMEMSGYQHGLAWESWIEIHPDDAESLGIRSGSTVSVRGPRAEFRTKAIVTKTVHKGTVSAPVGFGHTAMGRVAAGCGGSPLSLPHTDQDPGTGAPVWGPVPVFLSKA